MKKLAVPLAILGILEAGGLIWLTFKEKPVTIKPCSNITYTQSQLQVLKPGDTIFVTSDFNISFTRFNYDIGMSKTISSEVTKIIIIENNIKDEVLGYRFISANDTIYKRYCSLY